LKYKVTSDHGDQAAKKNSGPIQATVVSVIIRDFIQLTEKLPPAKLAGLMSHYYEKVCTQVEQQQGILTSISNFSMIVTFADVGSADVHARRALRCALTIAMIAHQTRFGIKQLFPDQGLDKFGVGIGIHSGEIIFAEFGLPPYVQQVASGHPVSIASLLASKSKELGWNVACSEQTLELAGHGVRTGETTLIGAEWLTKPLAVSEVVVVRNEQEFADNKVQQILDSTTELPRSNRTSRDLAFDPALHGKVIDNTSAKFPTIPGYRFLRAVGRGDMSSVFLVERMSDGEQLALKFADGSVSEDSDMLFSFVEEYGLLEQIRHPNVLHIYEQGVTDDALFILMEYLPGGTLKDHIGPTGMTSERAWNMLHEMAKALIEIHQVGIVHRDINPDNIMLRSDGSAVLGDFGVARRLIKERHNEFLEDVTGAANFMSPEQALGEVEDELTDIYSMGAVFFNTLTGEKPYLGNTHDEILQQHLHAPVPKLPQRYFHLQSILNRMMAKDRKERYSANELLIFMDRLQLTH
jgi:class 3 adenylate cyclase